MKLTPKKLNIIIDGQFGSTGKGLLASYVAMINHIDIGITNASANAGHTFYYHNKKYILKQLPTSAIVSDRCTIYLCAGAIINPSTLLKEIAQYNIDMGRIAIHPRCAIITNNDINIELSPGSPATKLASTQSGVGNALARKINRAATLAKDIPELSNMIKELDIQYLLDSGCTALMEVPQGFDLSLSSGLSYPHCTSREITVSAAMADAQVHPSYLGKVIACLRTYPIRVGNITNLNGVEVGYSGPFYSDSREISWEEIGVEPEYTTVTGRVRRVATFSMLQYKRMLSVIRPDYIFLNFANYLSKKELLELLAKLPEVTHLGFGPTHSDIITRAGYN